MEFRFRIDPDRITLDDQIVMEEIRSDPMSITKRQIRDLLARHMTDDKDNFVDFKRGQTLAGMLTQAQQLEALEKFHVAIQEAGRGMLPLANTSGFTAP